MICNRKMRATMPSIVMNGPPLLCADHFPSVRVVMEHSPSHTPHIPPLVSVKPVVPLKLQSVDTDDGRTTRRSSLELLATINSPAVHQYCLGRERGRETVIDKQHQNSMRVLQELRKRAQELLRKPSFNGEGSVTSPSAHAMVNLA